AARRPTSMRRRGLVDIAFPFRLVLFYAFAPPSTVKMLPVTMPAAGLARNATTLAISRGSAKRPMEERLRWKAAASPSAGFDSVSVDPGETRLTVMPCGPSSRDKPRVKARRADFDIA